MNSRSLTAAGLVVILALSACTGGSQQSSQSTFSSTSGAASVATTAPPSPTTAPPSPTTAPTIAPTPTEAPQPTTAPTNTPATQQQASGPSVSQGDIKAVVQAWASAKSYRTTIVANDLQSKGTFLIEIVRPDRMHLKGTIGGQPFESVRIGQDTYLYFNGKWTKTTGTSAGAVNIGPDPSQTADQINQGLKEGWSVTKGEVSAVDGQPCQEWVVTHKDASSSDTICVGLGNNLPLQIKPADGKWVMKFSDWNAPITIEPPM